MVKRSVPPASAIRTVTGAPAACLTALLTDSRQQRNTADSTSGGYRLPGAMSAVIDTGLAAPASSRSSATASPWSVSSIERTPPTVSVSTRSAASSWPASMSRRWTADSVRPLFASNSTSPSASRPDTRWCCTPSWRSRSIRRRSASISDTAVRRELAISALCATAARSWRSSSMPIRCASTTVPRTPAMSSSSWRRSACMPTTAACSTASVPICSSPWRMGTDSSADASSVPDRDHR